MKQENVFVFSLAPYHLEHIKREAEKATLHCERIGKKWWEIGLLGLRQLCAWGYAIEAAEVLEWEEIVKNIEGYELNSPLAEEQRSEILTFWDWLKDRQSVAGCECNLKKLLDQFEQ